MKSVLTILLAVLPLQVLGDQLPESLKLWKDQARFFRSLDARNEEKFKEALTGYYARVYGGDRFQLYEEWIREGSVESDHYSSVYSDLEDTKVLEIDKAGPRSYIVTTIQKSSYNLDYHSPTMETVVRDFKINNMTQPEIDNWLRGAGSSSEAEICLTVRSVVELELDDMALIHVETWSRIESSIQLNQGP